jgi:diguanylate cyclase (GGDEF)-like protein
MSLAHFNYDSLFIMTIMNLLTTGSIMLFVWNADRPGPGLSRIAIGDLMIGAGLAISLMRGFLPGGSLVLFSGVALFVGELLLLSGVVAFRGFARLPLPLYSVCAALYISAYSYWIFAHDDISARTALSSLCMAAIAIVLAAYMIAGMPKEDRRLYVFMAALYILQSIAMLIRAAWAIRHGVRDDMLEGSPPDFTSMFMLNFVTTGCGFAAAIASSRRLYHTTRALALRDPLTQLPNRRMLDERLSALRLRCESERLIIALIYLDLDNFKSINDTYGHRGGDEVLRIFAQRLRSTSEPRAFSARMGGDEFVVLMETVESRAAAVAFMELLVGSVQKEILLNDQKLSLAVSCGLALYPEDVPTVTELMPAADDHMYRAKRVSRFAAFPPARFNTSL